MSRTHKMYFCLFCFIFFLCTFSGTSHFLFRTRSQSVRGMLIVVCFPKSNVFLNDFITNTFKLKQLIYFKTSSILSALLFWEFSISITLCMIKFLRCSKWNFFADLQKIVVEVKYLSLKRYHSKGLTMVHSQTLYKCIYSKTCSSALHYTLYEV